MIVAMMLIFWGTHNSDGASFIGRANITKIAYAVSIVALITRLIVVASFLTAAGRLKPPATVVLTISTCIVLLLLCIALGLHV